VTSAICGFKGIAYLARIAREADGPGLLTVLACKHEYTNRAHCAAPDVSTVDPAASTALDLRRHPDQSTLMDAVAGIVEGALGDALAARGEASIAVPGGRTPVPLFERLARCPLDWARVHVTLTDERAVPVTEATSNERLVREHLLQGAAAGARFYPLMNGYEDPSVRAETAWSQIAWLPRPFDVVVLGMGEDGHFASLFPRMPGLAAALDPDVAPACVAACAPVAPQARISLNLASLLDTRLLLLPVVGPAKREVLERALQAAAQEDLPIRALLRQSRLPLQVHHADA